MSSIKEEAYAVIQKMPAKDINVPTMMEDGTLSITVDMDITRVKRILLNQKGTNYGGLYYKE
jgi:hypothetical protein